jgi:hypothetical protein
MVAFLKTTDLSHHCDIIQFVREGADCEALLFITYLYRVDIVVFKLKLILKNLGVGFTEVFLIKVFEN